MDSKMYDRARALLLFLAALAGVAHETLIAQAERPYLLALFAAMLGMPVIEAFKSREK